MSPCVVYQSEWCERLYDMNVMQKLKKLDAPTHTSLRAKRFPGLAAIAAALAAVPGLECVALAVVAVVVAGVVAYNVMSNGSEQRRKHDQRSGFKIPCAEKIQEKIKRFAEKAQKDIQQLAAKHNALCI